MTIFFLARKGYGTIAEIRGWDTPQFLDAVEYESIIADVENHLMQQAKGKK